MPPLALAGELFAHSVKGRPPEAWQRLDAHLAGTAALAGRFAASFGSEQWARYAGLLHDLGKSDPGFQAYLRTQNDLDDGGCDADRGTHSSAGAVYAVKTFGRIGRVLAYLVAGHHAGLPDWFPDQESPGGALAVRLQQDAAVPARVRDAAETVGRTLKPDLRPPASIAKAPESLHLWIRMLYSCLVDADFLDTEAFLKAEQTATRGGFEPLAVLKARFDAHMAQLARTAQATPVNAIRTEVLDACRRAAAASPGLFSLTVPTGGGKTLSAMAFALDHAVLHCRARVVYVIPYTSIIEQTADVLRGVLGAENVVEHHSNIAPDTQSRRALLATENWDAPVVITTNVQFFESLHAARSSHCRKLHNLVNAVVILDEAQLLPPDLLLPCTAALRHLAGHFGATIVLSTATQPALPALVAREIIPPELKLDERLKRVTYELPTPNATTDWPELAQQLAGHKQVLCVVNTRRDCLTLHRLMPQGTLHLSALMCGAHRSKAIRYIKGCLKRGRPLRVISTQLVEAGVDIDFPVVYRALAGLDSIAQAAGRCNREGRLAEAGRLGCVVVFALPRATTPPGMLRKGEDATRELMRLPDFDPAAPTSYTRYFQRFYGAVNDTGAAFDDLLVKNANPELAVQFRTAAARFKLIDDTAQRPVIVRYKDSEHWIVQLRAVGPKRENMRRLQRYTVNLPTHTAERLKNAGWLEETRDGILVQTMPSLYRSDIGLDIFREHLPPEDLIW